MSKDRRQPPQPPEGLTGVYTTRKTTDRSGRVTDEAWIQWNWKPISIKTGVVSLAIALATWGVNKAIEGQHQAGPPRVPDASSPSPIPDITFTLVPTTTTTEPTTITTEPTPVITTPPQILGPSRDCGVPFDFTYTNPEYSEIFYFKCIPTNKNGVPIDDPIEIRVRQKRANGDVDLRATSRTVEGDTITVPAATWAEYLAATTVTPDGCLATVKAGAKRPSVGLACPIQ